MNLHDTHSHHTLSRVNSRASHRSTRSRNSTLSRNQSLIKKNIELIDLKPADVLIERFVAWKVIVKQLTSYFEGIADIENNTAKELTKLAGVIQVPFKAGNQFLGEGGLQDVFYNVRDKTRIIADQHADLGRTIDSSIVQHLHKLRAEVKAHIKNVQNDTGKLAASVAKERELSTKLVGELANNISTFKNTPMAVVARNDPYLSNQAVARQLQRQVLEENLLQKSIIMMQQNSAHFEEGIVRSIQSAWQTFDEWQSRASASSQEIFRGLTEHLSALQPDREWISFAARSDHLLDPDTPLRDPEAINYPLKDDPSVQPLHTGHLERKKRFTRAYTESYFVLTPSGYLHEFPSSDPTALASAPTFSLFLPSCTLGPPSGANARGGHKFHIEGRKDGVGATSTKTGSFKALIPGIGHGGDGNKAWSFRSRSRDDMMEWWNDVRMLCARYLVASEAVDRTGPVEKAVRSVGYNESDYEDEGLEIGDEEEEEEEDVQLEVEEEDEEAVDTDGERAMHTADEGLGVTDNDADGDGDGEASTDDEGRHHAHGRAHHAVHQDHRRHEHHGQSLSQEDIAPPVYHPPQNGTTVVLAEKGYGGGVGGEKGYGGGGEKERQVVEIGPNGYALDRKHAPPPSSASRPSVLKKSAKATNANPSASERQPAVNQGGKNNYGIEPTLNPAYHAAPTLNSSSGIEHGHETSLESEGGQLGAKTKRATSTRASVHSNFNEADDVVAQRDRDEVKPIPRQQTGPTVDPGEDEEVTDADARLSGDTKVGEGVKTGLQDTAPAATARPSAASGLASAPAVSQDAPPQVHHEKAFGQTNDAVDVDADADADGDEDVDDMYVEDVKDVGGVTDVGNTKEAKDAKHESDTEKQGGGLLASIGSVVREVTGRA